MIQWATMKKVSHWTPRYICHRLVRLYFERYNPSSPDLAIGAIQFLNGWLKRKDICLEYGAGQSTAWFAKRVGHLYSIENSRFWYEKVMKTISGYNNVDLYLIDSKGHVVEGSCVCWDYVNKMDEFPPETFDFILNDGYARPHVGVRALPLLKKGGIFVWDDWANSFPTITHIPMALPANAVVKEKLLLDFLDIVNDWRRAVYDDGVHSTAIFFKPL